MKINGFEWKQFSFKFKKIVHSSRKYHYFIVLNFVFLFYCSFYTYFFVMLYRHTDLKLENLLFSCSDYDRVTNPRNSRQEMKKVRNASVKVLIGKNNAKREKRKKWNRKNRFWNLQMDFKIRFWNQFIFSFFFIFANLSKFVNWKCVTFPYKIAQVCLDCYNFYIHFCFVKWSR